MTDKTGGPAFPCKDICSRTEQGAYIADISSTGMDLRDYFAAAALQGMLAESSPPDEADELMRQVDYEGYCMDFAESAYHFADAMMKARKK